MKGILFKPWKIQAIRDNLGREWQTRRLSGLREINQEPDGWHLSASFLDGKARFYHDDGRELLVKSRYAFMDIVYIKEAWATDNRYNHLKPSEIPHTAKIFYLLDIAYDPFKMGIKRSPLFMPERIARDFIKITDARPERLQEITEEDALAEGIKIMAGTWQKIDLKAHKLIGEPQPYTARYHFEALWDSINPKYPFEGNYWIWRYKVELVEK